MLPLSAKKKYVSKDKDFGEVVIDGSPVYSNLIFKAQHEEPEINNEIIYRANIGEIFIISKIEYNKERKNKYKNIADCFQVILPTGEKGWIEPVNFKKSGWKLLETSTGKLQKDKDVTLTKLGFVTSPRAAVYAQPGYEEMVMDSVSFTDYFFIQDIMKSFSKRTQGYYNEWFQIVYPDLKLGWINKRDFKQSEVLMKVVNDTIKFSDFFDNERDLVALTGKKIYVEEGKRKEQVQITELLFDVHAPSDYFNMLDDGFKNCLFKEKWVNYSDTEVFEDANLLYLHGENGVKRLWEKVKNDTLYDTKYNYRFFTLTRNWMLNNLSYYSQQNKRMWEAIEYQEKRIELYPNDPNPYFQIATINIRLQKSDKALNIYLQILEKFPDNPVDHFEYYSTVHSDAFFQIRSLFNNESQDHNYKIYAYENVKELTESTLVYVMASYEICQLYKKQNRIDLMLNEIENTVNRYPGAIYHYFKGSLNYSFLMLSDVYKHYFFESQNPSKALDYILDIREQKLDSLLTIGTIFLEAKFFDEMAGSKEEVINLYSAFLKEKEKKPDNFYYMHSLNLNQGGYNSSYNDMLLIIAQKRLKAINTFETRVGYIKSENISIFESPDSLSAVTYNPKFNEEVNVLYPITKNDSIWYKIQTGDSLIAWVPKHNIVVEKIDEPEITEKNIKKQNYDTYNSQLPKVKAKKEKPSIIKKFLIFFNLYTETQIKIILTLIILLIAILFIVAVIKRRK